MADEEIIAEAVVEERVVEDARSLPAVRSSEAIVARDEISVEELLTQRDKIVQAMERAMRPGVHYGNIPGVQKPSLFKPGAELLNVLFRLAPSYHSERTWHDDGHLTVVSRCVLTHIPTSLVIGEGEGLCSTRETRYAYRQGGRVCPECGADAIIKGRAEYGGGWLCFGKKGGCGAKFADGTAMAELFENTEVGRVPNPDLADTFNTVLKMSDKRALVAAILNCTAASDVFTQDIEDSPSGAAGPELPTPTQRAFDPGTDLLPGAIQGENAGRRIAEALNGIDPTIDWQATLALLVADHYDKPSWRELEETTQSDFWRRLSNAVAWIYDHAPAGDFPPVPEEKIVEGLKFAFGNAVGFELLIKPPKSKEDAILTKEQAKEIDERLNNDDVEF